MGDVGRFGNLKNGLRDCEFRDCFVSVHFGSVHLRSVFVTHAKAQRR